MLGPQQAKLVAWMDEEGMAGDMKEVDWTARGFDEVAQEDINKWEEAMGRHFLNYTRAELLGQAQKRDFMLFPLNTIKDILEYQQLRHRDYWVKVEHPELGEAITYPGAFFKSSEALVNIRRRAPLIGEHNEEIYERELGLSKQELATLKQANVI
jgi:crotonobetainyl-CoA:carnitine CoA-transferase CaiB-like acyl-CoA transferase